MSIPCPIDTVSLPNLSNLKLNDLIVVVGPNSSGKTQLLHDIHEVVSGNSRQLVVASEIRLNNQLPAHEVYLDYLVHNGFMEHNESQPDRKIFRMLRSQAGTNESLPQGTIDDQSFRNWHQDFANSTGNSFQNEVPNFTFLNQIGRFLCSALFLNTRLTLANSTSNFDYETQAATDTLQTFYLSKTGKKELEKEVDRVFQQGIWIDITRGNTLALKASYSGGIPSAEDRLEPEEMKKYQGIGQAGDGIRSYVAICMTLLLAKHPLCLIDEPEMCLHPPQSYAIGQFIGKHADDSTCTIVATHSSHVLRGILETQPQAHIVRLTRAESRFAAHAIAPDLLQKAISKPRSRSEMILDGLFSDAVVMCESDGDRTVYESAYRTLEDKSLDIRFVARGGAGELSDGLKLYQGLAGCRREN